jgi:hypothetical protein
VMLVKWKLVLIHLETVNLNTRLVHGLCQTYRGMEMFLVAPDGTPSDEGQVEARFGLLGEGLISMPNRCTVYAEHAIGSEIISGTHDGTPRQRWSSGSSIQSVWRLC